MSKKYYCVDMLDEDEVSKLRLCVGTKVDRLVTLVRLQERIKQLNV